MIAVFPLGTALPFEAGRARLEAVDPGRISVLAPYPGRVGVFSDRLQAAHGMAFPQPNRATGKAGARCLWAGRDQAFLMGPEPDASLSEVGAVTDVTDGWVGVALTGADAEAVLARLVPVDLSAEVFKRGHVLRASLQNLNVLIRRSTADAFEIFAFRSLAGTLVQDVTAAMSGVAMRRDIADRSG
nr:sarcosine oxidase subunit gamma [Thalassococcus arenae]